MARTLRVLAAGAAAALAAHGCLMVDRHGDYASVRDYAHCAYDDDCAVDLACRVVSIDYGTVIASQRICTRACVTDVECPGDAACSRAPLSGATCLQRCTDTFDCPWKLACVDDPTRARSTGVCAPW